MNRPCFTRCPAPARTDWGVIRCVLVANRCKNPTHRRWRRFAWPMAVVWAIRPWWPNAKGRAADRHHSWGRALSDVQDHQDGSA